LGVKSFTTVIKAYDIDVLITDNAAPATVVEDLREHGVAVHLVSVSG
jgi:DeoR/GlpR family transcriptional regulator of sugar metabolism